MDKGTTEILKDDASSILPREINPYVSYSHGDFFDTYSPYLRFGFYTKVDDEICVAFLQYKRVSRVLVSAVGYFEINRFLFGEGKRSPLMFGELACVHRFLGDFYFV